MNSFSHCVIIDNNVQRGSLFEKKLKTEKIAQNIKLTLNCGHGLLYLKEMWHRLKEERTLVIMNVHTPIMNGLEFMEELKDTPYHKNENLLLLAVQDTLSNEDAEVCKSKGIKNFIPSDFSPVELTELLNTNFASLEKLPEPSQEEIEPEKPNDLTRQKSKDGKKSASGKRR